MVTRHIDHYRTLPAIVFMIWTCLAWSLIAAQPASYQGPSAIAVSADRSTLYVACYDACEVLWIDVPSEDVMRRLDVPSPPTGLALTPDGTHLLITCAAPESRVLVVDAASGQQIGLLRAGHTAMSPVMGRSGKRLYVCNRFDNDVSVFDVQKRRLIARIPAVREPVAAALTPDGRRLLVANHLPKMRTNVSILEEVTPIVTVIDTQTWDTSEIVLPNGANGVRGICVSPNGRYAFVTHLLSNFQEVPFRVDMGWINTNVVSVIDLDRQEVRATIGLDELDRGAANPWGIACSADGQYLCVTVSGTHEVGLIELETIVSDEARRTMSPLMGAWPIYLSLGETLWRRFPLPGRGPRALLCAGSKLYCAEYFSDSVAELDLADLDKTPRWIALGPEPVLTAERWGELLFHDSRVCFQQWQACASCHPDGRTDALNWDLLNDGQGNPKNTKSLLLAHESPPAMWEGVRPSAEVAVRSGLEHILFAERPEAEAEALDAYLQSLRPVASPHLVDGRLSAAAERGRELFFHSSVRCDRCHPPPLYTDLNRHNVGTRSPKDRTSLFDTPSLVETWRTAPYLHDGRYCTMEELLQVGRHGLRDVSLSDQQIRDLAAFVLSL